MKAQGSCWKPLSLKLLVRGSRHWLGSLHRGPADLEPAFPVGTRVRLQGITDACGRWQNGHLAVVTQFSKASRRYTVQLLACFHVATALRQDRLAAVVDGCADDGVAGHASTRAWGTGAWGNCVNQRALLGNG